ncbi:uncharacterized protein K460DRAFT_356926 [Cucurbitaria berberidis CBS 394.84]|uniref:Phospholipase A2 n=1 Tax=Cucurbitaria berberidis CBS 394.84 TaxID=1168544 RepID=A0A9P4GD59_9PLEO|nr:uncharacterized protein K460DRAFT_356926 [Cucurbitaria berberidis CBS 394.84]KAF1843161.1 hypothetical protein K460DRAFT_356926 [Cucurbitaria berberidis CBS 394.84]
MKSVLITIVGLVSLGLSSPVAPSEDLSLKKSTDEYIFNITLADFITIRNAAFEGIMLPDRLDWTSEGYEHMDTDLFRFAFDDACYRHDFGHLNFKKQNRYTEENKARLDMKLRNDMFIQCQSERYQAACEASASLYYEAHRAFGERPTTEAEPKDEE